MRQNPQVIKETDLNKKTIVTFFNTAFNLKQPAKASLLYSANAEARSIKGDTLLKGPTEIASALSSFLYNNDNIIYKPEWIFAEGEMVMVRWNINCTPKFDLFGIPAGKPVEIRAASFFRFIDRQIVSSVTYWNFVQK
jgi:ketosteroid isomerase-like protein